MPANEKEEVAAKPTTVHIHMSVPHCEKEAGLFRHINLTPFFTERFKLGKQKAGSRPKARLNSSWNPEPSYRCGNQRNKGNYRNRDLCFFARRKIAPNRSSKQSHMTITTAVPYGLVRQNIPIYYHCNDGKKISGEEGALHAHEMRLQIYSVTL